MVCLYGLHLWSMVVSQCKGRYVHWNIRLCFMALLGRWRRITWAFNRIQQKMSHPDLKLHKNKLRRVSWQVHRLGPFKCEKLHNFLVEPSQKHFPLKTIRQIGCKDTLSFNSLSCVRAQSPSPETKVLVPRPYLPLLKYFVYLGDNSSWVSQLRRVPSLMVRMWTSERGYCRKKCNSDA